MKNLSSLILFLFASVAHTFAQTTEVVCSFDHKAGVSPLVLNETIFPIWNNKKVRLSRAEFYISDVALQRPDGSLLPLLDYYLLVNAAQPGASFSLGAWPVTAVQGVTLHLGVPPSVNHSDPSLWHGTHPLAPQDPSMHWGWSAGYRFLAIEGEVDNDGDGTPETHFEFHNLGDVLYRTLELKGNKAAENGMLTLQFALDYAQLFKNIALTGDLLLHGSAAPNIAMMDNAATQSFLALLPTSATNEVLDNSLLITASPNPAHTATTLEYALPTKGLLDLLLINAAGQTVRSLPGLSSAATIPLETGSLPEGVYQCAFYQNGKLLARKPLVVQH